MEGKKIAISNETLKKARKIKGKLSYDRHYAKLLDFYMKEKGTTVPKLKKKAKPVRKIKHVKEKTVSQHEMKEALADVLDSLRYLEGRIDAVSKRQYMQKFQRTQRSPAVYNAIPIPAPKMKRNLFTKLVDRKLLTN